MEGNLFNSGFLGSKFLWWIGQVADDRTWRENQSAKKIEDPKEDQPAWGYRYKVRIMGCHDQDESTLESDNLPWAQVMYSVWGGGLAGSRQTPGIRQGMFVFGFFLDGQDMQVPVIMGVLGANAKTVVEKLKTGKDEDGQNFTPQSGWANAHDDECKKVPDEQLPLATPSSAPTKESTDAIHQTTAGDNKVETVLDKKHSIACPDPKHQSDTKNIQTAVEECSKQIESIERATKDFKDAVSKKLPISGVPPEVESVIKDTAGVVSGHTKSIMGKVHQLTNEKLQEKSAEMMNLAFPADKNKIFAEQVEALEGITCKFNALNAGLAALIGAALLKSFKRKAKQKQSSAVESAVAADPPPPSDSAVDVPPIPPKGFYQPNPICSTEELMGEVLGSTINEITSIFGSTQSGVVSNMNDGNNSDMNSLAGSAPGKGVDRSASQRNVIASLADGALIGGIAGALAAAVGVDKGIIGSVTGSFKAGNYGSGLASMFSLAGVSSDSGIVTAALNAIDSGDLVGGFTEAASALGVPTGLMANMGGAFSAIQSGDMSSLTGAVQGLAGFDAGILSSVAGMADGLPLAGMGALGGMEVDIAESMNFVQSITKLFECDPEPECSPNDEHTLDSGGSGAEEPNCASISESAKNASETGEKEPETKRVPIRNRRGRITGYRTVTVGD